MGDAVALYAVVSPAGKIRQNRWGGHKIYSKLSTATAQCRAEGDCVVEFYLNLDREPLFIRGKKVKP